jgi:hypothetical protein
MLLLIGAGLSRARGLGVAALAIAALLIVQPLTRISPGVGVPEESKSNAHLIGAAIRPDLPKRSLVLVSQPEAVPLFAFYLGPDLRYADPTGLVDDPTVMDWRNVEADLDAATVPGALAGPIEALRPGDRVLLVGPATALQETDTRWIQRFKNLDLEWQRFLSNHTCLRPIRRMGAPTNPSDYPYRATEFECR